MPIWFKVMSNVIAVVEASPIVAGVDAGNAVDITIFRPGLIDEGVLPTNLPSTSTSAELGVDDTLTAVTEFAVLADTSVACVGSTSRNLALESGMFPIT